MTRWILIAFSVLITTVFVSIAIAYLQQDRLVSELVSVSNEGFEGKVVVEDSHISPFKSFPYISIDLEGLQIYEGKEASSEVIVQVKDAYLGFDIWSILNGNFQIRSIVLDSGYMKLIQHVDGSYNIANAFKSTDNSSESVDEDDLHLDLQSIRLSNIDLLKLNESNNILIEAFVEAATSSYQTSKNGMEVNLETDFIFNLITDNDTSFLHDKHVSLQTGFLLDSLNKLQITPSELLIEKGTFLMDGTIDIENDMDLDLNFQGQKSSFDLFLAFAPPELAPLFDRYDNGGDIYFDAVVKGPSVNGNNPKIDIQFGCAEAFVLNTAVDEEVDELFFKGKFSNGDMRDLSTMSLTIEDFSATPSTGEFKGQISVKNFESPEIDVQVISDFDLNFLAKFLNISNLIDVTGQVSLELNFHDIVDLSQPEKSIEKLNESYFTRLDVKDLNFRNTDYALPVSDVNIQAYMDGHRASIDQLQFKVGESDLSISASISDLPAILHHTDIPVDALLNIKSDLIDLSELTYNEADSTSGIDEKIKDLSMLFSFRSSARAFTESPNLPIGTFKIENLFATFTKYPHQLHDFNADIFIDSVNFKVIDFTGMLDDTDFHFNGNLANYDLWFEDQPVGNSIIDFDLDSELIRLEDLFSYGGENYVPDDYRHEEFKDMKLHGIAHLEFDEKLVSSTIKVDNAEATMKIHPMRFEEFHGEFQLDSARLAIDNLGGKLGNSQFISALTYFFNPDSSQRHSFSLNASRLDFDQIFAYNPPPSSEDSAPVDHDSGFNIFELPFANLDFDFKIDQLNYHRYLFDDFEMAGRIQANHYAYLDTLHFRAAGGRMDMNGYFNGSNPESIYFSPTISVEDIDLDKLMFKFENFGQDYLVSENLHGKITGNVTGNIHMHADMVPSLDDSRLEMDVTVIDGSLNNFSAFNALSDYFTDKNLNNIRFDTLRNNFTFENGVLNIPTMNINSTLGYFELSGKQNINMDMEYYMSIPIKVVTKATFQRLFSKKEQDNAGQVDEIQYRDMTKRTRFVNVKIEGTPDKYNITLGKD